MKKEFIFIAMSLLMNSYIAFSQTDYEEDAPFIKRCYSGGTVGLSLGNSSFLEISPLFAYNVTPQLSTGIGFTYMTYRQRYTSNYTYVQNVLGARVFGNFILAKEEGSFAHNLFAHLEFEYLSIQVPSTVQHTATPLYNKKSVITPLGGLGYRSRIANNAFFTVMLLYNFDYGNPNSPYNSNSLPLLYRGGIVIGL